MNFQELLDERTLMKKEKSRKSGTMDIPGSEGAARKDVARAGFRKRGPVQEPKVEKSGEDVPVWVRTHKSKGDYAAHTAKKAHKEGEKVNTKELRKQFHQSGAKKDSEVHDITVGSPKRNIKEPGQKARAFVKTLKDVKDKMKERKGVATNTPTAISSSGKKRKRSDEEGAEQRGRIYQKLGMGERNPRTGVQMAKLGEAKTFEQFMFECNLHEEFKQMPAGRMARQMYKKEREEMNLSRAGIDRGYGRRTKATEAKRTKLKLQQNKMKLAMKQDYNKKGESYGKFYQDPTKTGKIRNPRFRDDNN
jgi:hypothetical protein